MLQILLSLSGLFFSLSQFHSASTDDDILNEASFLARNLVEHIRAAIVTWEDWVSWQAADHFFLRLTERERHKF